MPTKEEALYKNHSHIQGRGLKENHVLNAMDEWAKIDAIEFANFVGNRPLPEYSASTNQWRWWSNEKREYEFATTEELYQLYLSTKQQ